MILGMFSRMMSSNLPAVLDSCHIAVEIETEPHEHGRRHALELRLIDQDGRIMTNWSGELELPESAEPMHHRSFFSLPAPWDERFVFDHAGAYRFDVVRIQDDGEQDVLGGETLYVQIA